MTTLQARAMDIVMKTHAKAGKAMVQAGYSEASARTPKVLTESNAWKSVMQDYLPDEKLFKTHSEALGAVKQNEYTGEVSPDHAIRLKAVDMAYKLKGRGNDSVTNNQQINISFDSQGYIPPNNLLNLKPTLKSK